MQQQIVQLEEHHQGRYRSSTIFFFNPLSELIILMSRGTGKSQAKGSSYCYRLPMSLKFSLASRLRICGLNPSDQEICVMSFLIDI
jgi:hypothetical protein